MKLSLGLSPRDYSVAGGITYDADALAYFTANTAITSDADKNAINTFYLGLKSDGIYTKIKAMYLPIWGSASASKWNLVNPLDTDAAFRLNFSTGWTFSSGGATPNGASAYANTYFNPVTQSLTYNNNHLSYYSRTSAAGSELYSMGSGDSVNGGTALFIYRSSTQGAYDIGNALSNRLLWTGLNGLGFFVGSSITTNVGKVFRNSVQLQNKNPLTNVSMIGYNFYLGGFNEQNTNTYYSNKQCAFASIGNGLTDTESSNFSNRVNTLMTYFGINVY